MRRGRLGRPCIVAFEENSKMKKVINGKINALPQVGVDVPPRRFFDAVVLPVLERRCRDRYRNL